VTDRTRAFSIRIFLTDGSPDGVRTIEKSNWNGQGIVCPRSRFGEAKARLQFNRAGVYVLIGPSDTSDLLRVYVGEGDPIRPRIEQHATKKDFWNSVIAFSSDALNKAHVQYLEARLVQLAAGAKRCDLDNGNRPDLPSLSEADVADTEGFLDEMRLCLPLVGVNVFEKPSAAPSPHTLLHLGAKGIEARGYESGETFVVVAGSQAVTAEVPSIHPYLKDLRKTLLEKGVLKQNGPVLLVTEDYAFNSPSTAAGVLLGRTANGRIEWKDAHGRTLKSIQDSASAP
jgi:hypothetical protein